MTTSARLRDSLASDRVKPTEGNRRSVVRGRAERALDVLARRTCSRCDVALENGACVDCGVCYCPFCGAEASACCRHLLASAGYVSDSDDSTYLGGVSATLLIRSPFAARPMLCLPESSTGSLDWTDAQKRRALGPLLPVLSAWEGHRSLWREPSDVLLLQALADVGQLDLRRVATTADSAQDPDFADCLFCFDVTGTSATLESMGAPVEDALRRLASMPPRGKTLPEGRRCRSCDNPLGDGTACEVCDTGHCPYCGLGSHCWTHESGVALDLEECPHVVASPEDWADWRIDPFDGDDLPCLPGEGADVEWSDAELAAAFGDFAPLLEAYDGDLSSQPDSVRLFAAWAQSAPLPLVSISWSDGNMSETRGDDYYTPDPAAFRRAVNRLVRDLERGFRRLATRKAR